MNLVLSTGRDPYSKWTPMQQARAQWAADNFARMNRRSHLRGFHYWLVSQSPRPSWPDNGELYANTESHWERLCAATVWARYIGCGDWSNLIDRKHPDPLDLADYADYDPSPHYEAPSFDVGGLKAALMRGAPRYSTTGLSNYHLEVWVEKNSMNEALRPAIRRYDAVLQPLIGESSLERVTGAIHRIARHGKPTRIFYISDFDPSGQQMPVSVARKLEFYARDLGLDIRLNPLALTSEQVVKLRLPGIPTKATDSRAAAFVERFGDRATELDALEALHPGKLARIVSDALSPYVDPDKQYQVAAINDKLRERFREIVDNSDGDTADIAGLLNILADAHHAASQTLTAGVSYPHADHVAQEPNTWLLDTTRPASEQLAAYAAYRNKE